MRSSSFTSLLTVGWYGSISIYQIEIIIIVVLKRVTNELARYETVTDNKGRN